MLNSRQAASILSISRVRLKQILKSHPGLQFKRESGRNGIIKIPKETMSDLIKIRNKTVKRKKTVIKSQKGGVGGTSLTLQAALRVAESRGVKVLVIDTDPEASATSFLLPYNIDINKCKTLLEVFKNDVPLKECILPSKFSGVFIIPAKGIMRRIDRLLISENPKTLMNKKLKSIEKEFPTIFMDLPPTYSRLSESCYLASDLVILPTDPSAWGIEGVSLTYEDINLSCNEFEVTPPEIKILMNKYNSSRVATREAWEALLQNFKKMVLPLTIRESADLQNASNDGLSIFHRKCPEDVRVSIEELCHLVAPIQDLKETHQNLEVTH